MGKKLYVGNLSFSTTDEALARTFATFGQVESANVITDRYSGRSKGFGFVEMSSSESADQAIQKLNGSNLDGRTIAVNEARPMTPRDNNSRGGGFGANKSNRNGGFGRSDRGENNNDSSSNNN